MSREQQLARAFVALADTVSPGFDPLALFETLVGDCVQLLDVQASAVMMADARGGLRTMAASDEQAAFLELLQLQTGRGPCMQCYRSKTPVHVTDLEQAKDQWPRLVSAALDAGFRSMHALPLRVHEQIIGAVNLFRTSPGNMNADDTAVGQALADIAALSLLNWTNEAPRDGDIITRVQSAIVAKATVEMAKGMIARYGGLSIPDASTALHAYTQRRQARLSETAQALTERTLDLAEIISETARPQSRRTTT
ncbi:GAF and ANTAR domain-containing protein [Streptomyces sp. NPDC102467]|uniref:GAF and ANTAR domain-containing protein n=1 Tax=Streptomyces sp. NPDC102467 TaxID=3366179 RepID=UPI003812FF69